MSGDAVRAWIKLAWRAGASQESVEVAMRKADERDAWPVKKVSDLGTAT